MSAATAGGTFFRFTPGTVGASRAHALYITRERAVLDREAGVLTFNLPTSVEQARDYAELRDNLSCWAAVREETEIARQQSHGEPRTHYRALVSFERDVDTEKALRSVREWLEKEMPHARGFAVVHRDTEHTHVHVWIDARQTDGRKLHFSRERHRSLDSAWNQIYSRAMGRDPAEHERKKAQTREAKRQGWQRQQRPEYPPRTRHTPQELAPRWERREVGMQGAREPQGAPESFLERVRSRAGRDLREAESWGDLERRLDRHGLRVEARGAGLVVTDGRQVVKASSVDREASRAKLEKRFGEPLRHHKARAPEYDRAPAPVREAVAGLRELERRQRAREDHARAVQQAQAARARLDSLRWQDERARAAGEAFGRALGEVYAKPEAARAAFAGAAREHGLEHAARSMRERPEGFGELRAEERRRLLGMIRTQDTSAARQRAGNAAELGRQAAEARAPHARELARAAVLSRHMEQRAQAIGRTLAQAPDLTHTRAAVGLALQRMLPQEAAELARWLSAPQQQTAQQLVRAVGRLMPEDVRKLVEWVRAPHQALAAGAVRASKGLMQDRERERGGI